MGASLKRQIRNYFAFVVVFQFGDLVFGKSISGGTESHSIFPAVSNSRENTTRIVRESEQNAELYSDLIGILEKLNVISPTSTTCYVLHKIVREVVSEIDSGASRKLGVYLYFEEKLVEDYLRIPNGENLQSDSQSGLKDDSRLKIPEKDTDKMDSECKSTPSILIRPESDFRVYGGNTSSVEQNETGGPLAVLDSDTKEEESSKCSIFFSTTLVTEETIVFITNIYYCI